MGGDLTGVASNAQIAAGAVGPTELAALAVTTAKLDTGSVTNPKLAGSAVTNVKVDAAAGISVSKLAPGTNLQVLRTVSGVPTWTDPLDAAVGGDLSGTISNAQIVAGAVGTAELAALGVTDAKIASGITQSKITPGTESTVLTTVAGVPSWSAPASAAADPTINVKDSPYNAAGDCQTKRGTASIANGGLTLTVSNAVFVTGDVGKTMIVAFAGTGGGHLVTTIASRTSATVVQLSATSHAAITAGHVAWGTDDTAAWQAALDDIPGTAAVNGPAISGGLIVAPPGKYLLTAGLTYNGSAGLRIAGIGGYSFTNRAGGESEGGARLVTAGIDILTIEDTSPAPQIHSIGFQDIAVTTNGSGANGTAAGVRAFGASYGTVIECDFSAMGKGVWIDGTNGADSSWWKIDSNIFYSCGVGVYNTSQDYGNVDGGGSMELKGNVHLVYGTQIAVQVRDSVNYVKIYGGKADLQDGTATGIQIDAGKQIVIAGWTVEHHAAGEIPIKITGRGTTGNISITNPELAGGGSAGAGIQISGHARQMTDGVTTNGSAVITSASAAFLPCDDGMDISGTGIPVNTKIASVQSATQATMNKNATATATGVTFKVFQVVRDVSIVSGHILNYAYCVDFGPNTSSCRVDGTGCFNYGSRAIRFQAATAIAAAASYHHVPAITINGASSPRNLVIDDQGSENYVGLIQSDAKMEFLPVTSGAPAAQTGARTGAMYVDSASLWFEGDDGAFHQLSPSTAAAATLGSGTGSPVAVVSAALGSTYVQTDAVANYLWVKQTGGSGNTGWEQQVSIDGFDQDFLIRTTGNVVTGADQNGDFVRIAPNQMTLKRMKVTLKTLAAGAMVVQLRRSTNNGTSWVDVTGFTVTFANGAGIRTVDPTDVNINEGDWLGYSITTPSGANMEITLVGNWR